MHHSLTKAKAVGVYTPALVEAAGGDVIVGNRRVYEHAPGDIQLWWEDGYWL